MCQLGPSEYIPNRVNSFLTSLEESILRRHNYYIITTAYRRSWVLAANGWLDNHRTVSSRTHLNYQEKRTFSQNYKTVVNTTHTIDV
ncbi:hypothetical protein CDAR_220641 [Caerostris darwini]|uniref:Uncharacterized protein n=1 Tax=Caerostris darwini TaxID=1538125 RepID=A0AAV4PBB8_9ARAC|nr:hypothetical protein CDAR_220641 [Caerostris darwini]